MQKVSSSILLRFGVSGAISTLAYFLLANLLMLATGMADTICSFVAYLLSLILSYGLQSRFTFRVATGSRGQIMRFVFTAATGVVIATGLVQVCNELLGWPSVIATALVCILIPVANFIAFRWWVFVDTQSRA